MEAEERDKLTEKSDTLRIELKVWEKEFTATHNGQKASRDDIKRNPKIAAKYKEYNKTRDILSGKITPTPPPPPRTTPRKRKYEDEPRQEAKRLQITQTPSKNTIRPWEVDPYDSPSMVRNLFTPSKKTAIGPTPQKDGQVLGLFDLLGNDPSPTKPGESKDDVSRGTIQATPRKANTIGGDPHSGKYSRTPGSVSKSCTLATFATPLKHRNSNNIGNRTPSSVSKLHFSTPSFLKRDNLKLPMSTLNENDEHLSLSPDLVRVPRKPLMRGLSSMLAGLRKMEEEALDDDLDALREMENDMAGACKSAGNSVQVEDSQPRFPLGGLDDEAKYDSDAEEAKNPTLGRDGLPLKIYKKKGQKRTTRRVNMKPVRSKPGSTSMLAQDAAPSDDELAGLAEATHEAIPETQPNDLTTFSADARNFDSDSQSEYTASEGGTRYRRPNQGKKDRNVNKDGRVKTAARKVTALASQNFKRLKLRNSGAKGGVAHNSRFRRKK